MTDARDPFPRHLLPRVRRDLDLYPVVGIVGARQVGKSTLACQLAQERGLAYLTLDDRDTRDQARQDPQGLLARVASVGAVFDEIQREPDLLLALKAVVDRDQRVGRYLITGSDQPRVKAHVADSLLGRVGYRTLRPLTISEQRYDDTDRRWSGCFTLDLETLVDRLAESASMNGPLDWREVVATGGMPRVLAVPPEDRAPVLDNYMRTFVERDVREVLNIESTERFETFVRLIADRTARELNTSSLSRDLGIPVDTIRRWTGALERSYLVTLLPPYSGNTTHRAIKAPKLVLVDSALAMASAHASEATGFHLETLIANDLLVWRDEAAGRDLYHWRRPQGQEVDFVLAQQGTLVALEIKVANAISRNDARHLRAFRERYEKAVLGVLISSDPEVRMLDSAILAAPWWALL